MNPRDVESAPNAEIGGTARGELSSTTAGQPATPFRMGGQLTRHGRLFLRVV